MMAPSKETSVEGHLPVESSEGDAVAALQKTNLASLATHTTTTTSSDAMPSTTTRTAAELSGSVNTTTAALMIKPSTANELLLLAALREAESQNLRSEMHTFELQAANILNEAYADRLKKQLAAKEEKQTKKKKATRLVGDGLPCLLSGDEFYELAKEKEREVEEEARQKEAKKDGRAAYKLAMAEWNEAERERKDAKALANATFKKVEAAWTKKRDAAKAKGKKFSDPKPKRGAMPAALPWPKLKDFLEAGGAEEAADDDAEADDQDDSQGDESADDK
ncbi:hypothetical protein M413DRAFT_78950 [Hebeloma cylindrosporum]|uniref:Uncharacterized protein n=1 Tax=Hebeloma cylindrosporum TaxID=76867 RepID=A0A0C3BGS6_HEBCY|nr:hypothetical protein M413DRAFT_78950 [Hebeloma cylindrosporum h7]